MTSPRTLRFTIDGRLPGLNEVIRVGRGNRFGAAKQKRETQEFIAPFVPRPIARLESPVTVTVVFYEKDARRDADNVLAGGLKFILDTLVALGAIQGDGRKHVGTPIPDVQTDRTRPRIEVTVEEVRS
jgi:Holliday junction resolvase RusA-like endonuclease